MIVKVIATMSHQALPDNCCLNMTFVWLDWLPWSVVYLCCLDWVIERHGNHDFCLAGLEPACVRLQTAAGGSARVVQAVAVEELKWQKGVNAVGTHVSLRKGPSVAELDGEIVKTLFEAAGYPVDEDTRSAATAGGWEPHHKSIVMMTLFLKQKMSACPVAPLVVTSVMSKSKYRLWYTARLLHSSHTVLITARVDMLARHGGKFSLGDFVCKGVAA